MSTRSLLNFATRKRAPPQSDGSEYHSKFHPSLATLLRLYREQLDALGIVAQSTFRNVTSSSNSLHSRKARSILSRHDCLRKEYRQPDEKLKMFTEN